MRRRPTQELLDSDAGSPQEITASLRDLRWFNRWFGGISTSRALIEAVSRLTRQKDFSILEVASGEGFVPHLLKKEFEYSGIRLNITLLDRAVSHLPKNGTTAKVAADAFKLPFRDCSFDLVSCSLFVHHLAREEVIPFAKESLRVCRIAVLVHDLVRHPLHLAMAYAGLPLYRSRITRNDAPASVRQAYTTEEMLRLLESAGGAAVEIQRHFAFRMGAIAWKAR